LAAPIFMGRGRASYDGAISRFTVS
jgi:hypothetical protein